MLNDLRAGGSVCTCEGIAWRSDDMRKMVTKVPLSSASFASKGPAPAFRFLSRRTNSTTWFNINLVNIFVYLRNGKFGC